MDPLTAGLQLANSITLLILEIVKATPDAERAQAAKDWAAVLHNTVEFFQNSQKKINEAISK